MNCTKWHECGTKICTKLDFLPGLVTRLVLGPIFLFAGWMKLNDLAHVTEMFANMGFPMASVQAPFVAIVEFVGGIFILAGFATRMTSLFLFIIMVVATLTAHRADIVNMQALLGMSTFLYALLFLWLGIKGAGCWSVDACLKKRCQAKIS